MSGVCGVVASRDSCEAAGLLMAGAAGHRGLAASWQAEGVWLAGLTRHDGSPAGPWTDGEVALVADARIDNRDELAALLGRGRAEHRSEDGALILAAYRRWGPDCAGRLIGDFAFALWDGRRRRLFAARDPMGMRTFYYRCEPARTLFATEVKQILAAPDVPVRIHEPAVAAHLAGPYGRPEWTFYAGIEQLAPGHNLVLEEARQAVRRYWSLDPAEQIRYRDDEQYVERFLELFTEAVRCRLHGPAPVGLLLSGGSDSGSIAAVAGSLLERGEPVAPLHAYSFAFDELPDCDERAMSRLLVARYELAATDVPADDAWPLAGYPAHGPDRDDPFLNVYQLLFDRCLETARRDGRHRVLTGDRGDQVVGDGIFDPVGLFRSGRWMSLYRELGISAGSVRAPLRSARKFLSRRVRRWRGSLFATETVRAVMRNGAPWPVPWIHPAFAVASGVADTLACIAPPAPFDDAPRRRRHDRIFGHAAVRWSVDAERRWARHGLEYADPWSDVRLARFVLSIPQWVVQGAREPKRIARSAVADMLPQINGIRKVEPAALFELGLRQRSVPLVRELIQHSRAAELGFVDGAALRAVYEDYLVRGKATHDFWWPLSLELWLRDHWSGHT